MSIEAMKQALEALEKIDGAMPFPVGRSAITALRTAIEQAERQEPVAWTSITEPYPPGGELDILMGDGSVLCAVLPQADGDLWWGGSGTGEKFIDPQCANVTHWRVHSDTAPPAAHRQPLTDAEVLHLWAGDTPRPVLGKNKVLAFARAIEAAHGITGEKPDAA